MALLLLTVVRLMLLVPASVMVSAPLAYTLPPLPARATLRSSVALVMASVPAQTRLRRR